MKTQDQIHLDLLKERVEDAKEGIVIAAVYLERISDDLFAEKARWVIAAVREYYQALEELEDLSK